MYFSFDLNNGALALILYGQPVVKFTGFSSIILPHNIWCFRYQSLEPADIDLRSSYTDPFSRRGAEYFLQQARAAMGGN